MTLMNDVVIPVFDEMGLHYLRDGKEDNIVLVELRLDQDSGRRSLVTVATFDEQHDLKIFADACRIPDSRKAQVLTVLNDLNVDWRWCKWLLAPGNVVIIDTDVELTKSGDPRGQFGFAFTNLVHELNQHWRAVARAASQRSKRSKLERELSTILDGFQTHRADIGEE